MAKINISREVLSQTLAFVAAAVATLSKWTTTTVDDNIAKVLAAAAESEVLLNLIYMLLGYVEAEDSTPDQVPPIETDAGGVLRLVAAAPSADGTLALVQQTPLDSRVESLLGPEHVQALTAAGIGVDVFKAVLPLIIELLRRRRAGK